MKNYKIFCLILCILLMVFVTGCRQKQQEKNAATTVTETEENEFPGLLPEGERIDLPGIQVEDWDEDETTEPETEAIENEDQGKPKPTVTPEYIGNNNLPGIKVEDWDEDESETTEPSAAPAEPEETVPESTPESTPVAPEPTEPSTEPSTELDENETPGISGGADWD